MKSVPRGFVAITLCALAAAIAGHWIYFRVTHVTAAYAFVKGGVVEVGAPVEGQVVSVEVVPGQVVRAGDVLVRFNDARERAALAHARAVWEEAKLHVAVEEAQVRVLYETAQVTSSQLLARIEVSKAEARIASIDADLAQAQARRTSALRQQDIVAEEASDVSAAASEIALGKAEQATRRVAAAKAQLGTVDLQRAQAKARETRLGLLRAAADTAEAEVRAAESELALRVVRAARDGLVSRRLVEPGSALRVGGPLLEIWYEEDLSIEAWVDESVYATLDPAGLAKASLSGLDDKLFEGRLEWLGVVTERELRDAAFSVPVAKKLAQSRWVRARIILNDSDPRLMPGLTADVSIPRASLFAWARDLGATPFRWSPATGSAAKAAGSSKPDSMETMSTASP